MSKPVIVNKFGLMVGWGAVTCRIFGRDITGIRKIAYDDEQDMDNEYGGGTMPIGQSEGNYSAKASIELTIEERLAILSSLPPGKRIQDIAAFPVIVSYDYQGKIYKDIIHNCRLPNLGVDVKQGDKTISHEHNLKPSHIDWNV